MIPDISRDLLTLNVKRWPDCVLILFNKMTINADPKPMLNL